MRVLFSWARTASAQIGQPSLDPRGWSTDQGQEPIIWWLVFPQCRQKRFKGYNIHNQMVAIKPTRFPGLCVGSGFAWDILRHHSTCLGQLTPAFRMACRACNIKETS
ncbi:MAG: hypothetical protein PF443_05365 [Allgaiera sp.]|jgi:hypothetical protein|nr:hypothetical protein [Allgaiera sp.]